MKDIINIIIVEDSRTSALFTVKTIKESGINIRPAIVNSPEMLRNELSANNFDVVLSDFILESYTALDVIDVAKELQPDIPVIVISGAVGEETAVETMKRGAADFIRKENLFRLAPAIIRELEAAKVRINERDVSEKLKQLNEKLEHRVAERTSELNNINKKLRESLEIHKQVESELNDTKIFLDTILKNVPVKIYAKDLKNREIIYTNREMNRFLGEDTKDMPGKKNCDFFPSDTARLIDDIEESVVSSRESHEEDILDILMKDGTIRSVYLKIILVRNNRDEPLFILGVIDDLTEEVTNKKAKEEIESHFYKIFELSPVSIVLTDLDSEKIVNINQSACNMLGYAKEELNGINPLETGLWADPKHREEMLKVLSDESDIFKNEAIFRRKSGEKITVLLSAGLIDIQKKKQLLLMGVDISERKKAEREFAVAYERQKELNMLRSQFVSMISHEYRTPLTAIMLSADLLKRYGSNWTEEEKGKHFDRIQETVLKMTQMMENVLIIGNMDAGKFEFYPYNFKLKPFLYSISKNIEMNSGGRTSVNFKYLCSKDEYYLDENLVGLITSNLLTNAVKFSGESKEVNFFVLEKNGKLVLEVEDFGIGINKEDIERIFDPFFKVNSSNTVSGYGLGLAIVKKAVEAHGAEISVNSDRDRDRGTKFSVIINI